MVRLPMLLVGVHEESQTCEEADPSLQAMVRACIVLVLDGSSDGSI